MDKVKEQETFKTVSFFRKIKEKIAKETYEMTFQELKEYLKQQKSKAK